MPAPEDDDEIDGCEIDFTEHAVDDEVAELLALFPDSVADEDLARQYRELAEAEAAAAIVPGLLIGDED